MRGRGALFTLVFRKMLNPWQLENPHVMSVGRPHELTSHRPHGLLERPLGLNLSLLVEGVPFVRFEVPLLVLNMDTVAKAPEFFETIIIVAVSQLEKIVSSSAGYILIELVDMARSDVVDCLRGQIAYTLPSKHPDTRVQVIEDCLDNRYLQQDDWLAEEPLFIVGHAVKLLIKEPHDREVVVNVISELEVADEAAVDLKHVRAA